MNKTECFTEKERFVLVQMHFIHRKQFSEINLTSQQPQRKRKHN